METLQLTTQSQPVLSESVPSRLLETSDIINTVLQASDWNTVSSMANSDRRHASHACRQVIEERIQSRLRSVLAPFLGDDSPETLEAFVESLRSDPPGPITGLRPLRLPQLWDSHIHGDVYRVSPCLQLP